MIRVGGHWINPDEVVSIVVGIEGRPYRYGLGGDGTDYVDWYVRLNLRGGSSVTAEIERIDINDADMAQPYMEALAALWAGRIDEASSRPDISGERKEVA